jgi:hypothetical protein
MYPSTTQLFHLMMGTAAQIHRSIDGMISPKGIANILQCSRSISKTTERYYRWRIRAICSQAC